MNWQKSLKGKISFNEPLKKHTSFKIGGKARFFIQPSGLPGLLSALKLAREEKIPLRILGAGSNILAGDGKLNCAVLNLSVPAFKKLTLKGAGIQAGSGVFLSRLLEAAQKEGVSGFEFLAGIPGTIGGALAMNAGAWGKNIADYVENAVVMDYNGKIFNLPKKQIRFGYRSSSLSRYIILSAGLKGQKGEKSVIAKRVRDYLALRKARQDLSRPCAGSIFKNPPNIAAGKLIDLCGLKGKRIGGAAISGKHANFILNRGNAKAAEVLRLIELIKRQVKKKFKITLEPEIKIWH